MSKTASEPTLTCPNCASEIKLTEGLAAPLIAATKADYEERLAAQDKAVSEREKALALQRKEIEAAKDKLDDAVAQKLKVERASLVERANKKAQAAAAESISAKDEALKEMEERLATGTEKLREAQKQQADLMRAQRELEDKERELNLTVEKKVQAGLGEVREKAAREANAAMELKVMEKDQQLAGMTKQIEDLKRRAEQGSQQMQGEVLELALEETLRAKFAFDTIEPVGKGEFGGDVMQRVTSPAGAPCGAILWETKRTKNWSDGWLAKLRKDQRAANAEIAIIISQALHKDVETFGMVDGVWVTGPQYYVPLAIALRQSLIDVHSVKLAGVGQQTKTEQVYDYLTGPRFRQRVEAIVEKFGDMQADLDRERKSMMRLWAKRQQQIDGVIESTVGMYGDLQGIAGQAIQEIDGLEIPLLEGDNE